MRTVWDVSTFLDTFPEQLRQRRASMPTKVELVRAVDRMLDDLVHEPRALVVDTNALVGNYNALLQQAKEQFRGADTLRLIEPLGLDASVASSPSGCPWSSAPSRPSWRVQPRRFAERRRNMVIPATEAR